MAHVLHNEGTNFKNPRYLVDSCLTSEKDDDCELTVRCNGKLFYLRISPSGFKNSPAIIKEYLAYLEVLRSGEEQIDGVFEDDFYKWASQPFEPLFAELAPATNLASGRVTLQDYLFPAFFVCALEAINDRLVPCRIDTQISGRMPPGVWLWPEELEDLKTWTASFPPTEVELCAKDPADVLYTRPEKVLVAGGKTARFFKPFSPGALPHAKAELQAFKKIATADVAPDARICRLHGVVQDKDGLVMGMLLTYIEHDKTLSLAVRRDTPFSLRKQWVDQVSETLAKLHRARVVWGDAKPENVLVDTANNAWIVDFGGGYTPGWVDKEKAKTIEGDLQGMANISTWILK